MQRNNALKNNLYQNSLNSSNDRFAHLDLVQSYQRKNVGTRWAIMRKKLAFSGSSISPTFPRLILLKEIQFCPKQPDMDQICIADLPIHHQKCGSGQCNNNHNTIESRHYSYDKQSGDFFLCMRPILILGRILGILPVSGVFVNPDQEQSVGLTHLSFGWNTFSVLCNVLVLLILGTNTVLSFLNLFKLFADGSGGNASQLAFAARDPMFYLMSFLIYTFFLVRTKSLTKLFVKWRIVTDDLGFKDKDIKLFKHIVILAVTIFGFGIFENVFYIVSNNFPISTRHTNQTTFISNFSTSFETYFLRSHPFWATLISYNPFLTAILLITKMLASLSWTYADLFLVLCSRALYYKFKILVDQTTHNFLGNEKSLDKNFLSISQNQAGFQWSQVRKDHLTLCKLLDEFEQFLSPLIFLSYSANIFFICLEIHQGLTPHNPSYLGSAFSLCSFIHLLLRVLAVSIMAAKVNEYVHQITLCIQRCSTKEYCSELERMERMLSAGPIGLSGLGCFVVTRAFLLMVVSVIFTVEIVLLQASATPQQQLLLQQQGAMSTTETPN